MREMFLSGIFVFVVKDLVVCINWLKSFAVFVLLNNLVLYLIVRFMLDVFFYILNIRLYFFF